MDIYLLLIFCIGVVADPGADDLAEFSNNLATDVGPLLVLFGESMTKQYLSESTSFLDYFIFAMAPIGLLTAIVSTIRLCGHSSFRAFIGRSQEGRGTVEAELCTSTSRDVCELFNNGGITRVLGRPSILELIYIPPRSSEGDENPNAEDAGLYLFYDHLSQKQDSSDWREENKAAKSTDLQSLLAPYPNLSLNVGIIQLGKKEVSIIALTGLVLQVGILALAGVGVWHLGWNLSNGENSSSRDYAPVMYIIGTVLMCIGMGSCAALIGQTTREHRFKRKKERRSSLIWLQPGPQVIGDESFDPFAYFEDTTSKPLLVWTSSTKDLDQQFEVYTVISVSAVLLGYIMQFIGLRGMKAWVSLAQLGITVVMSILRGCLRMKRLSKDANKLAEIPDRVSGHELDWLSFEIAQQLKQKSYSDWHITGWYEQAEVVETQLMDSKPGPQSQALQSGGTYDELFQIRLRLAHLTGHIPFQNIDALKHQKWKDGFVKVRTKAAQLSNAVCLAAAKNFPHFQQKKDIILRIQAAALSNCDQTPSRIISVTLKPPPEFSPSGWSMDSASVEAILGLWMWALISDKRLEADHETFTEKVAQARIISASHDFKKSNDNMQTEMDMWLGPEAVKFREATLTFNKHNFYGLASLWAKDSTEPEDVWKTLSKDPLAKPTHTSLQRFCGWNSVHRELIPKAVSSTNAAATTTISDQQADKVKLQLCFAQLGLKDNALLDLCVQELFTTLVLSLSDFLTLKEPTMVWSGDMMRLQSTTVSNLATSFVECGLGSHSDALLCIIPALGNKLSFPHPDKTISNDEDSWESLPLSIAAANGQTALVKLLLMKGADPEVRDRTGRTVLSWAAATSGSNDIIKLLLDNERVDPDSKDENGWTPLWWALKAGHKNAILLLSQGGANVDSKDNYGWTPLLWELVIARETFIWLLLESGVNAELKDPEGRTPLSWAAGNGLEAAVELLLEKGANTESIDESNWTPIFWAVLNRRETIIQQLFRNGANIEHVDVDGRTPFWWAAELGYRDIVQLLLDEGANIDSSDKYGRTPLWAAAAIGRWAVVGTGIRSADMDDWIIQSWAAESGREAVVQLLLENDVNIESADEDGLTPLSRAAATGHEAVVQLLLDKGATTSSKDKLSRTPLYWARSNGHDTIIQLLLREGTNTQSKDSRQNRTQLLEAAKDGNESFVRQLLEQGTYIECENQDGCTPLLYAVSANQEAVAQLLLDKNANAESKDLEGRTPLLLAAQNGYEAIVKLLLNKNVQIESKDKLQDWTPLAWAAKRGHTNVVQLLLESGANTEPETSSGWTPLLCAAASGHEAIVNSLLTNGADPEKENLGGRTALSWAAGNGFDRVIKLLLNNEKVNPDSKDINKRTALSWAAEKGFDIVVKLLLDSGRVDRNSVDVNGWTSLSWAEKGGNSVVIGLLRL